MLFRSLIVLTSLWIGFEASAQEIRVGYVTDQNEFVDKTERKSNYKKITENFIEQSMNMVDMVLKGYQIKTVLNVDLEKFKSEIPKVKVFFLLNQDKMLGLKKSETDVRVGAYNVSSKDARLIFVNEDSFLNISGGDVGSTLLLHEFLVVLGYSDQTYQISMLIKTLVDLQDLSIKKDFLKLTQGPSSELLKSLPLYAGGGGEGGATSVGNGGDTNTLKFFKLMIELMRRLNQSSRDILKFAVRLYENEVIVTGTTQKLSCDQSNLFFQLDSENKKLYLNQDLMSYVYSKFVVHLGVDPQTGRMGQLNAQETTQCQRYMYLNLMSLKKQLTNE